jgi:hypothetical protein
MSNLTDEHQACLDEIDTLNYDPQTEGVNTALTCFLDLDFDSAIVGLSHHLRGKVMGWCEVKNTSPEPGMMDFELWTAELGDFAVIRLRRVSAQRCAVDFHPVFLPEWGYRLGVPTEREEWEGRKIRNQRAKAHLKTVLGYALEQMCLEADPPQLSAAQPMETGAGNNGAMASWGDVDIAIVDMTNDDSFLRRHDEGRGLSDQSFTFDTNYYGVLDHFTGSARRRTFVFIWQKNTSLAKEAQVILFGDETPSSGNWAIGVSATFAPYEPVGYMNVATIYLTQNRLGECQANLKWLKDIMHSPTNQMAKIEWEWACGLAAHVWRRAIEAWITRNLSVAQSSQPNAGAVVHGQAGRKTDRLYDQAFEMITEGTPQNKAREWFFEQAKIKPDQAATKAFNTAIRRRRKATK